MKGIYIQWSFVQVKEHKKIGDTPVLPANCKIISTHNRKVCRKGNNDTYVLDAMVKTQAMWQMINKEIGKVPLNDLRQELRIEKSIISNPNEVAENQIHTFQVM